MLLRGLILRRFGGVKAGRLRRGNIVDREVLTDANDHPKRTYLGAYSTLELCLTWMDRS